ncbi:MAG: hypothetical protein H0V30_07060 [Chitinophagaceae bacterium]|nr:hypothetical protein [Chitinophagaceae bacterium]
MKKSFLFLGLMLLFLNPQFLSAQENRSDHQLKIALFAPLYLDSAFDRSTNYVYGKNFPKFLNPGLEFYEGAKMALDSLSELGLKLEVFVFDTKSNQITITQQINSLIKEDIGLIIAHASANEIRTFADAALTLKVPFINANLPNDGAVNSNPFFVILNPTLKTQTEGIYKFVQKHYTTKPIVVFRKKGQMEDLIKKYFDDFGDNSSSKQANLKYVDLPVNFTLGHLLPHLDTNTHNVVIAGSLDENFGRKLAAGLAEINKMGPVTVVGMPTWSNIRDFNKQEYKGLEIITSTPFYQSKNDRLIEHIGNQFSSMMYARPSDMVFRGFEVTWRFVNLLNKYKRDIASNFGVADNNLFTQFDIQPVFLNRENMTLDYFENKRLYFVKLQDGYIKEVL